MTHISGSHPSTTTPFANKTQLNPFSNTKRVIHVLILRMAPTAAKNRALCTFLVAQELHTIHGPHPCTACKLIDRSQAQVGLFLPSHTQVLDSTLPLQQKTTLAAVHQTVQLAGATITLIEMGAVKACLMIMVSQDPPGQQAACGVAAFGLVDRTASGPQLLISCYQTTVLSNQLPNHKTTCCQMHIVNLLMEACLQDFHRSKTTSWRMAMLHLHMQGQLTFLHTSYCLIKGKAN